MTSSGLGQAVWARRPPKTYLSPYLAVGDTFGRTGPMQEGAVPLPVNPLLSVREVVTVTTGGRCPVGGGLGRSDV
jgi:hypothetical protein